MNRKHFLTLVAGLLSIRSALWSKAPVNPELHYFQDDGIVPNSPLPLLVYYKAFEERELKGATWLEQKFLSNNWYNSWRNGIFTFQHYHSITHEVLGIYSGEALVLLGGESGKKVEIEAGTIVVIPAGVGHKNLESHKLGVVGAYPNGMAVDIMRCEPGERPRVDDNIRKVPVPAEDPLLGPADGLVKRWG